jgi:hypothetical protein
MKADTDILNIALRNPEGNPCYFQFELLLSESGESLYTSGLVPPGLVVIEQRLARPLPAGSYGLTIRISTISLANQAPMNSADVETTLRVR